MSSNFHNHELSILDELEYPDRKVIEALEENNMTTRLYAGPEGLEELADALRVIYRHITKLDKGNLAEWNITLIELMSLYGRATGQRYDFDAKAKPMPDYDGPALVGGE